MSNPFIPKLVRIEKIIEETHDIKTFRLKFLSEEEMKSFKFNPGQFVTVTVFGVGEAPFAISSSPYEREYFEVSVRAVGNVTRALHRLSEGDIIGVRGPFGKGFPLEELEGKNIIFLAGGTGLLGVSAMLWYIYHNRDKFGRIVLFYGVRTPKDFVRRYDLDTWSKRFEVYLTVDRGDETWKGHVGVVTTFLDEIPVPKENVAFIVCGPPIMLRVTYKILTEKMGYKPNQIYVSLERHMKCGMGKCGRCMLSNGMYVCKDGPIFRCDKIPERDIG